jgi:LruC domain-containing protein/uncharacterized repeat protein (TIGR01451 family)
MQHNLLLRRTLLWLFPLMFSLGFIGSPAFAAQNSNEPALTLELSASQATVVAGNEATYVVILSNVGGATAHNLALTPTIGSGASYIAGSAQLGGIAIADPSNNAWSVPNLAVNASHTLSFRVRVGTSVANGQEFTVTIAASGTNSAGKRIDTSSSQYAADTDSDDRATANMYGPLNWNQESLIVAYEDLKRFSWSDWDYNDFVVRMVIRRGYQPNGRLAAIEVRYTALARGAGFLNHAFYHQMPFEGGGWYRVSETTAAGAAVRSTQRNYENNPAALIFGSTRVALPEPAAGQQTNTRPDQGSVIAGYQATLVAVLNKPTSSNGRSMQLPWDPYLYVPETQQSIHIIQPGRLDNTQVVTNLHDRSSPLIGYDLPLAQVLPDTWRWPSENIGIWRGYPSFTDYIRNGGSKALDWHSKGLVHSALWGGAIPQPTFSLAAEGSSPTSRYFAGSVAADLNGDGLDEIIVGNLLANQLEIYDSQRRMLVGWPQAVGGGIRAAATVAELDGDATPEVLVGAADGVLYAWNADGTAVTGWPVALNSAGSSYRILASPAIGNLDSDPQPEVVVPLANGKLYAIEHNGSIRAGWPISIGNVDDQYASQIANSSPRIADVDGNGSMEIVVGSTDKHLYVFNNDGSLRWKYATGDMILGAPVVAEIDPNRPGLEIGVGSGDGLFYLFDSNGTLIWSAATDWTIRSTPIVADMDGNGSLEILIGSDDNHLHAWHRDGSTVAGWPQQTGGDLLASPALGDIDGDGKADIVIGSEDGMIYAWHTNGSPIPGWPKQVAAAIKGTAVLTNLDNDIQAEVAVADMAGNYNVFGGTYTIGLPLVGSR